MNHKLEAFLVEVTSKIHSRKAQKLAILELRSHLLDKIDSLVAAGASYEDAEAEAIREMGSSQNICTEFSKVYRPEFLLKLAMGLVASLFAVTLAVAFYFDFKAQGKWAIRNAEAEVSYANVASDISALAALPFSDHADTSSLRDAATYLDPLLQTKKESKVIDLDRLLSFDYWEITREFKDGRVASPNVMYLYDYTKLELAQSKRTPLQTLRLYRKIAELYHSNETMVSTYLSIALLQQEREFYEKSVKAKTIREADWNPVSPEILASAKRAVRASNAYFGIIGNSANIPHAEKLCWAIGVSTLMAIRVRPLLDGKFPFETNYQSNFAQIDHLLDVSRPYCRLHYIRHDWANPTIREIDDRFEIKPYIAKPLWLAMQVGPYLPYLRRVVAKVFMTEFNSDWLYRYDATAAATSKSST